MAASLSAALIKTSLQSNQTPSSLTKNNKTGINLNNQAMATINAAKTTSQIGSRIDTIENDIGNSFIASSVDIFKSSQ